MLTKIKNFLLNDTSGAVTVDWTVLTLMLVVSMAASLGTMGASVHMLASVVTETAETPISVSGSGSGGGSGGGDEFGS